jgi:hypothetical protein
LIGISWEGSSRRPRPIKDCRARGGRRRRRIRRRRRRRRGGEEEEEEEDRPAVSLCVPVCKTRA